MTTALLLALAGAVPGAPAAAQDFTGVFDMGLLTGGRQFALSVLKLFATDKELAPASDRGPPVRRSFGKLFCEGHDWRAEADRASQQLQQRHRARTTSVGCAIPHDCAAGSR
ncbi:hypothetical protein U1872_05100 [Sphingomonas sp. RB3P16]|uniref:hypothetical protein n=1 Tax=Parasphingomonas frigoris TaxID=3096163 RepID=UPI002FCC9A08